MNAPTTILRLTCVAVLLTGWCYAPGMKAQQSGAAPGPSRNFWMPSRKETQPESASFSNKTPS